MKIKTLGFAFIAVRMIMIVYTGFYSMTNEKVIDFGRIEIEKEKNHPVQWSSILGALLVVGGVVMIVTDKRVAFSKL